MSLAQQIVSELHYPDSPGFLRPGKETSFEEAAGFGHVFRRARQHCNLQGVYTLRQSETKERDAVIPVVYVCEAKDERDAERIHRLVWNQNVVPFLIVASRTEVRLYSGFRYEPARDGKPHQHAGILQAASDLNTALGFLEAFRAERIDDGTLWDEWGDKTTPETRVDWRLLSSLNDLDRWLQGNGIQDPQVSHALIGKYVYLHYLRSRDILSDRKLERWNLAPEQLFGRNARISAFRAANDQLDEWLNGSVFPIEASRSAGLRQEHIRKVAGTFAGDDPASGQLALDFKDYDFAFIPIETLSVIYEQFLHAPTEDGKPSRGKSQGAYYTPVPLVNFMLEEIDSLHPFKQGIKVLDPACGSGAFLVQCYRRIIEQDDEFDPRKPMRPARLRELLEQHLFGIDRDLDACRVAELSLSLTLLDYVHPPDLEGTPRFRLPDLHGRNIFQGDFFDPEASWRNRLPERGFDWVVGNPPWVELKRGKISEKDRFAWSWMQDAGNQNERPVGGNQVAEAFAWEAEKFLGDNGCAALLLPAMTLFKDESCKFRQRFLEALAIHAVANFANLAEVLFPGHRYRSGRLTTVSRPRRPAAAFFYSHGKRPRSGDRISVFSPLVADQLANRPNRPGGRRDTWSIAVDASQVRSLELPLVAEGSALPWKTAMWGSHLDLRLLKAIGRRFPALESFCDHRDLKLAQGFELRSASSKEGTEHLRELVGANELEMTALKHCGLIFEFPGNALKRITADRANLRLRGGRRGLKVSYPPHVIVDKVRRFAVYSDDFIAVPPRQIGIAGNASQSSLLKALSLYVISDFAIYHQFLVSPEWGVSTSISTLDALKALPVPLGNLSGKDLAAWAEFHTRIVAAARNRDGQTELWSDRTEGRGNLGQLLSELNETIFDFLELSADQRILVSDLVHLRMQMAQGKVTRDTIRGATEDEVREYAEVLRNELDAFIDDQPGLKHSVTVVADARSAMVAVTLENGQPRTLPTSVAQADSPTARQFAGIQERIQREHRQWVYFRRNLRVYQGRATYVLKPLQRMHWTRSQALLDAGSIIAETLS